MIAKLINFTIKYIDIILFKMGNDHSIEKRCPSGYTKCKSCNANGCKICNNSGFVITKNLYNLLYKFWIYKNFDLWYKDNYSKLTKKDLEQWAIVKEMLSSIKFQLTWIRNSKK